MHITQPMLARIRDGDVDLAFRRWRRAMIKPGSRLRTSVGLLEVVGIETVERSAVTDEEAQRAGSSSAEDLLRRLDTRDEGEIHRIELRWVGADPRVELRERSDLNDEELAEIRARLDRMDAASRHGPWTETVLELIAKRPDVPAEELAASLGRVKLPFKRDVWKLKELGLTESRNPGYRLSPRGRAVLEALVERPPPAPKKGGA